MKLDQLCLCALCSTTPMHLCSKSLNSTHKTKQKFQVYSFFVFLIVALISFPMLFQWAKWVWCFVRNFFSWFPAWAQWKSRLDHIDTRTSFKAAEVLMKRVHLSLCQESEKWGSFEARFRNLSKAQSSRKTALKKDLIRLIILKEYINCLSKSSKTTNFGQSRIFVVIVHLQQKLDVRSLWFSKKGFFQ